MKQYFYPAVFHTAEEGGFWVSFPDFPECLTQGDSMEEAYEMANEALGLTITDRLTDHEALPVPSLPGQIELDDENSSLVVLCFDLEAYRKKHNSKAVKKTLSIPEWLNEEAMAKGPSGGAFGQNTGSVEYLHTAYENPRVPALGF